MEACDFLFPKDLRLSPSGIQNVLVIGSCLSQAYIENFRSIAPAVTFDYVAFNNFSTLPDDPPRDIGVYDFILIQMPLRYVVTDQVIAFTDFSSPDQNRAICEGSLDRSKLMLDACLKYSKTSRLLTFVCNFVVPQTPVANALDRIGTTFDFGTLVRRLNECLANAVHPTGNVFMADVDTLSNSMGKRFFLDDYIAFYSHAAYWGTFHREFDLNEKHNAVGRIEHLPPLDEVYLINEAAMFRAVWDMLDSMYRTIRQIDPVKLVIFDLDDTLWRGQIAEHYTDAGSWPYEHGWPLGIWEAVQHLRARGVLTAICSKNTAELVQERWKRAVSEPWVSLDDFLFKEIGWNTKAESIARIIQQASLTPRSVVFVDDNPVERESVSSALPGLRVIGSNPYVTKRILLWSSETQIASVSSETEKRETMMRQQRVRETERTALSRDEFLAGLGCAVHIYQVDPSGARCNRAVELLNKTNQFNTTGLRHTSAELIRFVDEGGRLIAFDVTDKFTSYGLVGVILFKAGHFQQFAMSCRVLGLDIETSVLKAIIAQERSANALAEVSAEVRNTESNAVCRDVYRHCGFDAGEPQRLPIGAPVEVAPHLTITGPEMMEGTAREVPQLVGS